MREKVIITFSCIMFLVPSFSKYYFLCNSSKKVTKKSRRRTSNDAKPSRNCFSGKPRCSFLCGCDRARRKQLFSFEALLAFVKLLTSFVRQYLRSSLSYGFFFRRCCNAGKIYSHPPPKQAKIFRCPCGRKARGVKRKMLTQIPQIKS